MEWEKKAVAIYSQFDSQVDFNVGGKTDEDCAD